MINKLTKISTIYFRSIFFIHEQQIKFPKYIQLLNKYNRKLKKPSIELIEQQVSIFSQLVLANNHTSIISLLLQIKHLKLFSIKTLSILNQYYACKWIELTNKQQILIMFIMAHFTSFQLMQRYQNHIFSNISTYNHQSLVSYTFCSLLMCMIEGKAMNKTKWQCIWSQIVSIQQQQWIYGDQLKLMKQIFVPKNDQPSIAMNQTNIHRSPLQLEIQCFLSVLNYHYQREISVNGYDMDFMVQKKNKNKNNNYSNDNVIIQVNGSYHYTAEQRMKGIYCLKGLLVNKYIPIRYIHHMDYNQTKGHRNKLALITSLIEQQNNPNFIPKYQGYNSNWQLQFNKNQLF